MTKILMMTGLVMNLIATIFIYLGSKHLPWDKQSIGGKTDKEKTFYEVRGRQIKTGLLLLFLGFLFQLISAIY
jgi:hypothetical protein